MEISGNQNPILKRQAPLLNRLLDALFASMFFCFPSTTKAPTKTLQVMAPILAAVIDICQMASLLFLSISTAGFPNAVRRITNTIRIDGLAGDSSLLYLFVLIHMCLIAGVYIGLVSIAMARNKGGTVLKSAISGVVQYFQYVSFLPTLVSFETYIRYWLAEEQDVYSQPPQFAGMLGPLSLVFGPLLLGIVLLAVFFDYSFLYDPRQLHFNCRSQSFELLCHYVARFCVVTLYVVLGRTGSMWSRLLFLAAGGAVAAIVLRGLPFYTVVSNAALLWTNVSLAWCALVTVLGETLGSDLVPVLLFVFLSPLLLAILSCEVLRRMSPAYEAHSLEVLFRRELARIVKTGSSDEKRAQSLLNQMRAATRDADRMCLLEASFYLHYLNNHEATQQSLTRFLWKKPSLETRFQRYRLIRASNSQQEERELKYLQMVVTAQRVQEADADICYKLMLFLQEMDSRYCQLGRLEKLASGLADSSRALLSECRMNLQKFPRSSRLLYLYGSFLEEVLNDSTGRSYRERSQSITDSSAEKGTGDTIHSFESYAVICISASRDSLGSVHFLNDKAAHTFGLDKSEELTLEQLLPPELACLHTDVLEKVVLTGLPLSHLVRLYSCLQTSKQSSGLARVHVKLLFWRELPYFFVSAQQDTERRAFVMFNTQCLVICHSDNLGTLLQGQEKDYRNCYLLDEFPALPKQLLELPPGSTVPFCADSSLVTVFEHVRIGAKLFYSLSVLTPEKERLTFHKAVVHRSFNQLARDKIVHFNPESDHAISINVPNEEKDFDPKVTSESQLKPTSVAASTSMFSQLSGSSLSGSQASVHLSSLYAHEARRVSKRLRVLMLLSILLVIGLFLSTGVFLVDVLRRLQEAEVVEEMSRRRHLGIDMAGKMRRLQLIEAGLDTASREDIVEELRNDISNYTFSLNLIKRKVEEWSDSDNSQVYFEANTPLFEQRQGQVFITLADLFGASYRLLAHVSAVASAPSLAQCHESQYYVIRNSPAETFQLVNHTMFLFVQDESALRDKNFAIAEGLFYGVMIALVFSALCVVLPQVVLLERRSQLIWKAIFGAPFQSKVETKHRIVDRLQFLHNIELPVAEGTRQEKDVAPRHVPRIWPGLTLKLGAVAVFSALTLAIVVFVIYSNLKDQLRTIPNYLNWAGVRACDAYSINYWLKEMRLEQSPFFELDQNTYYPSAEHQLNHSLNSVIFTKNLMASKDAGYGLYLAQDSIQYKNYRYQSACQQGNDLPDCENKVENYGLYYSIAEYVQLAAHLRAGHKDLSWTDLILFEQAKEDVFYTSKKGSSVYSSEAKVLVTNDKVKLIVSVSLYAVFMLLSYFFYYAQMLRAVGEGLADRASLLRMVAGK